MANKPNSLQEAILKELAKHSLAAEFVFQPDRPRGTNDEPADLVWACNKCIILMYMMAPEDRPGQEKRTRIRKKAIEHNLRQARGWLRAWKRGIYLHGNNGFRTFSLKYDSKCHIVVLSVIKCEDALVTFHDEEAKKLGVTACATLPQSAVEYIAHAGGTTLDLLLVMDYLRQKWGAGPMRENDVLDMIYSYIQAGCREIGLEKHWPGGKVDDHFHEATYPLLAARRKKSREGADKPSSQWVGMENLNDVFNDIHFGEFLYIAIAIKDGMDATRNRPELHETLLIGHAKLTTYDFCLCFAFGVTDEIRKRVRAALDEWHNQLLAGTFRYGPILLMDSQSGEFQFWLGERTGQSQTELLLDKWAAR